MRPGQGQGTRNPRTDRVKLYKPPAKGGRTHPLGQQEAPGKQRRGTRRPGEGRAPRTQIPDEEDSTKEKAGRPYMCRYIRARSSSKKDDPMWHNSPATGSCRTKKCMQQPAQGQGSVPLYVPVYQDTQCVPEDHPMAKRPLDTASELQRGMLVKPSPPKTLPPTTNRPPQQ